mgnify:CR=1 FL=1
MEFKYAPAHPDENNPEIRVQTKNKEWQDSTVFYELAYDFIYNLFDERNPTLTMRMDDSNLFGIKNRFFGHKTFRIKYYVCIRDCTLPPILEGINPRFRFDINEQRAIDAGPRVGNLRFMDVYIYGHRT